MKYISTRGDRTPRSFSEILLEGLAPDGGLYLPESYPRVDDATLARWRYEEEQSQDLNRRDRSAIYGGFHLYVLAD